MSKEPVTTREIALAMAALPIGVCGTCARKSESFPVWPRIWCKWHEISYRVNDSCDFYLSNREAEQ